MNKPSSIMKDIYGKIFQFSHYKSAIRLKTNNVSNTSKFVVTEEQIQNDDNSIDDPPRRPEPSDCCQEGCVMCVWYEYVIKLKYYTNNDRAKLKEAIELIPNGDVKEFVKFELGKQGDKL